ncbi:GHMP kinase [Chloroflexota bacterium]
MFLRSKAPLRISFGGGGTDVSPYCEEHGGVTLSATICKYTYASLQPRNDSTIRAVSLDYNHATDFNPSKEILYDGNLDLVKATVKTLGITTGCELYLHSDVPPGSGLGSSSSLTVALVGLFQQWKRLATTPYEIAELAYEVERKEAQIAGGRQDQYAASFGGFNFIEFRRDATIVNPLRIRRDIANELEYRMLLCNTGQTRLSAGIIEDQMRNYKMGKKDVLNALSKTKELAIAMKTSILLGNIDELGYLLNEAWQAKKLFTSQISDSDIDELYSIAKNNGAIGGKLLGAGGGGYLLLLCHFDKKHNVVEKLESVGRKVIDFAFDYSGLQVWGVNKYVG